MQCPMCQHRISSWAGFKSPSPVHIRCDGCGLVLRVRMRGLVYYLAVCIPLLATVVGYTTWHFLEYHDATSYQLAVVSLLLLVAMEYGTLRLYARYAELEGRRNP